MSISIAVVAALVQGHAFYEGPDKPYRVVEGENPMHVRNYEPYDSKYKSLEAQANVTELHVVFSNHLDVGFNVRAWCDGDDGCTSAGLTKTGLPCRPWAYWVLNENINTFLPRAVNTANVMNADGDGDKYVYMTQPWVASFYLDCEQTGFKDWRNPTEGLGPDIIQCPNASSIAAFKKAVKDRSIFWQAFPHNAQPGTYESSLFEASLMQGAWMADELGVERPSTFSQRDETGMTRAILPLLKKHNITMISLGSGGSSEGHPVIPNIFVWKDLASDSEVIFSFDHGYGGGTHILPNGHALFCAWNTDNGGPQTPESAKSILAGLRKKYPNAKVHASTFDDFAAIALTVKDQLPVVTSEIGDTWLYGVPSDPWKNVMFREFSRLRRACVESKQCDPTDAVFRSFDRLLTKIPEHTWGEDTTWYLHDYLNWTNAQIGTAMHQPNYNMTVESWREQRSYIVNAMGLLAADAKYASFGKQLAAAMKSLAALTDEPKPSAMKYTKAPASKHNAPFTCTLPAAAAAGGGGDAVVHITFGADGSISELETEKHAWKGALGKYTYQTLAPSNFTDFDNDYGNEGCTPQTENPGCHNFNKPNMSSAGATYNEVVPTVNSIWHSADGCSFAVESTIPAFGGNVAYGSPQKVWTSVTLSARKETGNDATPANNNNNGNVGGNGGGVTADIVSNWVGKATTRLAEASWVSFEPTVQNYKSGWMISSLDTVVDPTDVVTHGAVHLHSMGALGAMVYTGPEGTISIASLDAPVVSCGILSPFPTPGDNSTLKENMAKGMHWNTQNNIWNTNYPQWYPFEGTDFTIYGAKDASLGANAAFRFKVDVY